MENDMKKERLISKLGGRLEIMTNRVNRAAISIRCRNATLLLQAADSHMEPAPVTVLWIIRLYLIIKTNRLGVNQIFDTIRFPLHSIRTQRYIC